MINNAIIRGLLLVAQEVRLAVSEQQRMNYADNNNINCVEQSAVSDDAVVLAIGGLCTGSGVVVMHYLGMSAIAFPGKITWDYGVIVASILIALVASMAAFWILFRLLSLYPQKELLRLGSAVVMTIAVCGMHYTGMVAATFTYSPGQSSGASASTISADEAFYISFAATLCFIMVLIILILADLRAWLYSVTYNLKRADDLVTKLQGARLNDTPALLAKYLHARELRESIDREASRSLLLRSSFDNNHSTISNATNEVSVVYSHHIGSVRTPRERSGSASSSDGEAHKDYRVLAKPSTGSSTRNNKRHIGSSSSNSGRIHSIDETQPTLILTGTVSGDDEWDSHSLAASVQGEHQIKLAPVRRMSLPLKSNDHDHASSGVVLDGIATCNRHDEVEGVDVEAQVEMGTEQKVDDAEQCLTVHELFDQVVREEAQKQLQLQMLQPTRSVLTACDSDVRQFDDSPC
eukprot:gene22942-29127_t